APAEQDLAERRDRLDAELGHPTLEAEAFVDLILGGEPAIDEDLPEQRGAAVRSGSFGHGFEGLLLQFDQPFDVLGPEVAPGDHDGAERSGGIPLLGLQAIEELLAGDRALPHRDLPEEKVAEAAGHRAGIIAEMGG